MHIKFEFKKINVKENDICIESCAGHSVLSTDSRGNRLARIEPSKELSSEREPRCTNLRLLLHFKQMHC